MSMVPLLKLFGLPEVPPSKDTVAPAAIVIVFVPAAGLKVKAVPPAASVALLLNVQMPVGERLASMVSGWLTLTVPPAAGTAPPDHTETSVQSPLVTVFCANATTDASNASARKALFSIGGVQLKEPGREDKG